MSRNEDNDVRAACYGKERFSAQRAAEVRKRYPKASAYKCEFCGHFHLGDKRAKRKMKPHRKL